MAFVVYIKVRKRHDCQLSMQEKLARAIDKEMNSKISSKSRTTRDVIFQSVKKNSKLGIKKLPKINKKCIA
jgi:hypothetical protein